MFSKEAADKLVALTKKCRLDSQTNTIRLGLAVLDDLITVIQKGGSISIRDGTGKEELYHPLLEKE